MRVIFLKIITFFFVSNQQLKNKTSIYYNILISAIDD